MTPAPMHTSALTPIFDAERLLMSGNLNAAAEMAHGVLASTPQVALALNILGIVAAKQGNSEGAFALWQTATRVGPTVAQPWISLGEAMFHIGRPLEAAEAFREALVRQPELTQVLIQRGIALQSAGRFEEAIDALRRGIQKNPADLEARVSLATALHEARRTDQAIATLREAAAIAPHETKVWSNLGVLHEKLDQFEQAIECYGRALACNPNDAHTLYNRGSSLIQSLKIAEARRDWQAALRIRPEDLNVRNNLAILELLDGNFERGFELFESRWGVKHQKFPVPAPEWDGSSLDGKHLLCYVEQGLGDALQFCRFATELKRRYRCRVTICTLPTLHGLLRSLKDIDAVVDVHPPYPRCDVQCSLLSIPFHLKTSLATIPAQTPYLHASTDSLSKWKARIGSSKKPRIGLFWQGTQVDPNRTIRLQQLLPVWDAVDATFISFQKGFGEEELMGFSRPITHIGPELIDFSDTAAALSQLDLLLTIDTSIAHAAGAIGLPTWVLLPYRPDWRWLLARSDSPWYPSMRLFRQVARGSWLEPIIQVATAAKAFF